MGAQGEALQLERPAARGRAQGVERCGFRGEDVLMVMNWLAPGWTSTPHSHPFEQLVCIVQGRARFHVGEETFEAGPGSLLRIPPGVEHWAEPLGDEPALNLDIFAPIREDYRHLVAYQEPDFADD